MLVLPLIIMGTLLIIGGLASLFLPETRGKNLPQTIEEGEAVPLSFFNCGCFCCCTETPRSPDLNNLALVAKYKRQREREQIGRGRRQPITVCSICKTEIKET